jgi:Sigma-54 interaction domain/FHA domain/Bacterial regulatory protein, Fis family
VAITTETLTGDAAAEAAAPGPYLVLALEAARPDAGSARWSLAGIDEVQLGRGADRRARRSGRVLGLELPDPSLSTRHARILRDGGGWIVEDAGSKNGTHVGGARIDRTTVADHAVIDAGRCFVVLGDGGGALDPGDATIAVDEAGSGGELDTLDPRLAATFAVLVRVARAQVPILILGETGTGKELLANAIHRASARAGACVAVNCAAIPANLVESELFGYRRGAFSGASEDRLGLVRASDGGTLFLDEIAELGLGPQAALLRVLQEREVVPLGATAPVAVDLRVVAATCQDPAALVALGRFREDLLARVAGHTVTLPPLRRRAADLGLLIARVLRRHAGGRAITLARETARAMFLHDWPRNVRELDHALASAIAIGGDGGELELAHLPAELRAPRKPPTPTPAPRPIPTDRDALAALLREHSGNVTHVARALCISRTQLRRLAAKVGLDPDGFRR